MNSTAISHDSRFFLPAPLCAVVAAVALLTPATVDAAGTGVIKGEIVGPGGTPIAEAWACAYLVASEEFAESCDLADGAGAYSIPGLEAGDYKVEFWSESVEPSYVGELYDDKHFWDEADEVEVDEGTVTFGIDAELAEAATIEGEVDAASLGGPVEHTAVCAYIPAGGPVGCAFGRTDGTYTFPGLPTGEYRIEFLPASNLYNLLPQQYDHKSMLAEADILAVAAGETQTGIDADLEAGAEVHGTVYSSASGAPAPKVLVCALFVEEAGEDWGLKECLPTSSTGSYGLFGLPTDAYKIVFSPEFKEFFSEDVFEKKDDGYLTQYFDDKPTLAAADVLTLVAPEVRTGIDGHIQPEHPVTVSPPLVPAISPVVATPRIRHKVPRRHCRPGFRRKKVADKRRCMRAHKHRHRHLGHRNGRG